MAGEKKKVFLISSSSSIKKIFIETFSHHPLIELCGTSESTILPEEELVFSAPDFVLLDITLYQEEKGIIRNLLDDFPNITIFMLCDLYISKEVELITRALCLGVADYIQKPIDLEPTEAEKFKIQVANKILTWQTKANFTSSSFHKTTDHLNHYDVVGIHCSTGGFHALIQILPKLPKDFPLPIFVNIDLPKIFAKSFLERLNQLSNLYVKEIKENEVLTPSTVYLIFGKSSLDIQKESNKKLLLTKSNTLESENKFFQIVAGNFHVHSIGLILTGGGASLVEEIQFFKEKGGLVILQDEGTSILWENARPLYELNLFDMLLSIQEIPDKLCQLAWI
ncbi:MAG: hypothetical protein N3A69_00310 [Leptospiraceae bacterium]|nr:hypothetical protein [Leptospiraceae bacterium]